jgi:putative transposase
VANIICKNSVPEAVCLIGELVANFIVRPHLRLTDEPIVIPQITIGAALLSTHFKQSQQGWSAFHEGVPPPSHEDKHQDVTNPSLANLLVPTPVDPSTVLRQPVLSEVGVFRHDELEAGYEYLGVVQQRLEEPLCCSQVVGWSMKPSLSRELAIDALLMAVWRRKPKNAVLVHSDQGSQYGSDDWRRFCKANNLEPSMSRRGNCWDNAVARADIFDYIEVFYNRTRRHSHLGHVSPEAFERASM